MDIPSQLHHLKSWVRQIDKSGIGWAPLIASIVQADSKEVTALQAADLLAWIINRHYTEGDREPWHGGTKPINGASFLLDSIASLKMHCGEIWIYGTTEKQIPQDRG